MTSRSSCVLNPRLEYTARLEARRTTAARYERHDLRLSQLRIGLAALFLLIAAFSLWVPVFSAWWLLLPSAVFVVAFIVHARVIDVKTRAVNAAIFYERGRARIDDRWSGQGLPHDPSADGPHLYAPDLDVFGRGSLFELLCTAHTRAGQNTLAGWLSEPATPEEILARQEAVAELRYCLDLREALASAGPGTHDAMPLEDVTQWGVEPPEFPTPAMRVMVTIAAAGTLTALSATVWSASPVAWPVFLGCLACECALALMCRARVRRVLRRADHHRADLNAVSRVLQRMQQEPLRSNRIVALCAALTTDGRSPTSRIAQLNRLLDLSTLKGLDLPIALLFMWQWDFVFAPFSFVFLLTHCVFALESWRARHGAEIASWVRTAGEFEALCALACYAYEHPDDPFPEIAEAGPVFDGVDLRHPLIPAVRCVPNTVRLDAQLQLLVVSGSNMSGKSTLLRTVGINALLALTGAPVRATRLRLSKLALGAVLRIQDSLQTGTSAFDSAVLRMAPIVDRARADPPMLFLFDELLHGTNPHDRRVGAEALLRTLLGSRAIGLVTTHDPALTELESVLSPHVANVHFRNDLTDGVMSFDYRIHPGPARTTNALALMAAARLIGDPPVQEIPSASAATVDSAGQSEANLPAPKRQTGKALIWTRAIIKALYSVIRRLPI